MIAGRHQVSRDLIETMLVEDGSTSRPTRRVADDDPNRTLVKEWEALQTPRAQYHVEDRFVSHTSDVSDWAASMDGTAIGDLAGTIAGASRVTRLREVRVLKGFHRYDQLALVPSDLGYDVGWLPGIEVYGEGIFLQLDEDRLAQWEKLPAVVARASRIDARRGGSFLADALPAASPRFVMLHTLAHLLMRQLVFDTGFSSASLRERLYIDKDLPMAGLLIYTSAGDSEGSMGGLARQGFPAPLLSSLSKALMAATWCSLDPVCGESGGQGTDSLSLAACHGCTLVSETSCIHRNVLLDRNLLITPGTGFFATEIESLLQARTTL